MDDVLPGKVILDELGNEAFFGDEIDHGDVGDGDDAFGDEVGDGGDAVDDDEGVADERGLHGGGAACDDAGSGVVEGGARGVDEVYGDWLGVDEGLRHDPLARGECRG